MTHLKVAVRVRPLSHRETETHSISIVSVESGNTIAITNTKVPEQNAGDSRERIRRFTFDYCFHENSTQDDVFEAVENVVGKAIKHRYNSCVLAYGQSSSGKTHTMMGFPHDPGLTPRLCKRVFNYLEETAVNDEDLKATVSYLEIYNEKVRDLLIDRSENGKLGPAPKLKVREHPKKGPYVQGLVEHPVADPDSLQQWLHLGNSNRRVAATLTNPESSRSHSVLTVTCSGVKLNLVDLAGSERAGSRCYGTSRFREGANINKSLVALGNVISALAEQTHKFSSGIRRRFVPYRDSVLTWLLKDTLGGNSTTVMIATISPSSICYSETVNTLRFGQRAKLIVSSPVVNEDPKEKIIRELRAEIGRLRELLNSTKIQIPENLMPQNCIPSLVESISEESPNQQIEIDENSSVILPITEIEELITNNSTNQELSNNNNNNNLCQKITQEKLIPVMDISTTVTKTKKQTPKLRRTFSVGNSSLIMDENKRKMFSSQDAVNTLKNKKVPAATSQPSLRRRSIDKSNSSLKSIVQRKSSDTTIKKIEKSVGTELKSFQNVEAKVDSIRKSANTKPRSEIVAAVTHRLYAKTKKKEAATDTDDIKTLNVEVPKELQICSNARMRLKELTRKALHAHRNRNEETQTDLFPVLRVKEISTSVEDLKLALEEVKDVETCTDTTSTRDIAINCIYLENFSNENLQCKKSFIVTRSCGTQSTEKLELMTSNKEPSTISFTKYLRDVTDPKIKNFDQLNSCPVYTSSVNISISHNCKNNGKSTDSSSDDSLNDENRENMCFPTPDLISNHNSLEPHTHASSNTINDAMESIHIEVQYANLNNLIEEYFTSDELILNETLNEIFQATITSIPKCNEQLNSVNIPCVYASQTCVVGEFTEFCQNFCYSPPDLAKPTIIEYKGYNEDCIKLIEPIVLKSIMKHFPEPNSLTSSEESVNSNLEIPDSLDGYRMNSKKVRFTKKKLQNDRMMRAMSGFLEEATILMNNLTTAASNLENRIMINKDFDLKVTVNEISGLEAKRKKRRKPEKRSKEDVKIQTESKSTQDDYAQTINSNTVNSSTQFQDFDIAANKYELLLKDSCRRLEEKINSPVNRNRHYSRPFYMENFPPNVPYNPWDLNQSNNDNEDTSLESNPVTFSDYGSLPRRAYKRQRTPTCSPSAFLRQLTSMRKQVVESSREELLNDSNNH